MNSVTCIAPVNIAVIKYWGKRDETLILPLNDSLSGTLSTDQMCAKTTVMASPNFTKNKIWLNGKEESFNNARLQNCLKEIQNRARGSYESKDLLSWNIHVCSENNFPTAAGLASSAAGYACLVYALAALYGFDGDVSAIARQGSGSACRSVLGGFVRWHAGVQESGADSIATQVVPASHWPEMRVLILVVSDQTKHTSSTGGMARSVQTSELLKHRVKCCVPQRTDYIIEAIKAKDFKTFAEITMQDSNQFHAVCLDTYPPCVYMNDVSHAIVELVHKYNTAAGNVKVAYTFDAGPNACLYLLKDDLPQLLSVINNVFPAEKNTVEYIKGIQEQPVNVPDHLQKALGIKPQKPGLLKYIIHTKIGEGPKVITDQSQCLLDNEGLPKSLIF